MVGVGRQADSGHIIRKEAMTPTKPDAFVRAVEKVASDGISGGAWAVTIEEAEQLLHPHHAKIERLVRRLRKQCIDDGEADGSVEGLGYWHVKEAACTDLLAILKRMRQ